MRKQPEFQKRPVELAEKAWERGYIEAFELARIAAWKSAKGVAAITVNKAEEIEAWSRAAMAAVKPWKGKQATALDDAEWDDWQLTANQAIGWVDRKTATSAGLLALKGVEYPMATAILDILDPHVWPVLDQWAAKTVFGEAPARYCAARYTAYARHLATEGPKHWSGDLSIHGLDVKAQLASMNEDQLPAGWRTAELPPCR